MNANSDTLEREVSITDIDSNTLATLNKSEIDIQIATAKRYPRSIKAFRDETLAMVTLSEEVADSCIYSLPRGGKTIEGASARFAEIVVSAWGNSRAGARVVSESGKFVTAQGAFYDLQRNVAITYEVQRRITDKNGNRYKDDMIGVTANAACSIALRNAVLKGIPKAFWGSMYEAARQTVMGDYQTLGNRRAKAFKAFLAYGISQEQVLEMLGVKGEEDITLEHLVTLRGTLTALKDGDTMPEMLFSKITETGQTRPKSETIKEKLKSRAPEPPPNVDKATGEITGPVTGSGPVTGIEEEIVEPVGRQQKPPQKKAATDTAGKKPEYNFNQILTKIDEAQTELAVDDAESDKEFVEDLTETLRKEISDYAVRRKRKIAQG